MKATIPQPLKRKSRSARKMAGEADTTGDEIGTVDPDDLPDLLPEGEQPTMSMSWREPAQLATLEARDITAWFGDHMVLDQVSLTMEAGEVTALIVPSGGGKSTFLRILNRMH